MSSSPDSTADSAAGATPPSSATTSTPTKNSALSPPMPEERVEQATVTAQMTDGHDDRGQPRDQVSFGAGRADDQDEPRLGLLVGDHVDVDLAGLLHDRRADALVEDAGPPRPPRRADHQLGGVHLAGEVQQRGGHVVADDGVQRWRPGWWRARAPCPSAARTHRTVRRRERRARPSARRWTSTRSEMPGAPASPTPGRR